MKNIFILFLLSMMIISCINSKPILIKTPNNKIYVCDNTENSIIDLSDTVVFTQYEPVKFDCLFNKN